MQSLWAHKRRHPRSAVRCNYQSQTHSTVCDPSLTAALTGDLPLVKKEKKTLPLSWPGHAHPTPRLVNFPQF